MEKKYCVCNYEGDLIGHDLSEIHARDLCAEMQQEEPDAGWEVMEQECA